MSYLFTRCLHFDQMYSLSCTLCTLNVVNDLTGYQIRFDKSCIIAFLKVALLPRLSETTPAPSTPLYQTPRLPGLKWKTLN